MSDKLIQEIRKEVQEIKKETILENNEDKSQELIILSDEQKSKIIARIKDEAKLPPSIKELTKIVFNVDSDGRDRRGRAIKRFCASIDFNPSKFVKNPVDEVILTPEQELFIQNHHMNVPVLELTKTLFKNNEITPLHKETRAVLSYITSLNPAVAFNPENADIPDGNYKPPRTREQAIQRIGKYVHEGIDKNKIDPKMIKNLESLISHLHVLRFLHQINNYVSQIDRDLFESTFIRYIWNKASDLSSEEVDQFIVLSSETVIAANIQKRIEAMQNLMDEKVSESSGEDRIKISMTIVEAINSLQNEYNASVKRQSNLLSDLNGKRSERLKNKVAENQSLVTLVEFWKNYENRQQLLLLAEKRREGIKEEIKRLENMEDVKIQIFGISPDEILNS